MVERSGVFERSDVDLGDVARWNEPLAEALETEASTLPVAVGSVVNGLEETAHGLRGAELAWPLTRPEAECLLVLSIQPLPIRRIGDILCRGRPTIRTALKALTASGLCRVVTNASGPAVIHRLTPKGEEVVRTLRAARAAIATIPIIPRSRRLL